MHDESLSIAIKDAGETFEPPWLDARAVAQRGRRRWWLTRAVAATTSLALVGAAAVIATRVDFGDRARPAPAAALTEWEPIEKGPLIGRIETASAWTGEELIVVGGRAEDTGLYVRDGAAYRPDTGRWEEIPSIPMAVSGATSVWTGRELILWGGERPDGQFTRSTGFAFDPATRAWRPLPASPYWSRRGHSAVWTGTEMIVWGGVPNPYRVYGAAYDPKTDEWRRISNGPLGSRANHEAVWADDRMIVWGGRWQDGNVSTDIDGAEYDPGTDEWTALPLSPLGGATAATSFWSGKEMIVNGGLAQESATRAGAAYDPLARTWREIADVPVATERYDAPIPLTERQTTPAWTGDRALFVTSGGVLAYDPAADEWSKVPAPRDAWRASATVAWTGAELLVWSGSRPDREGYFETGWTARP